MTEPNGENSFASGITRVWIADLADTPTLPVSITDFDTLDPAFVDLGFVTTDDGKFSAKRTVKERYTAGLPEGVPYRIDVVYGPGTLTAKNLELTRETFDAAFGGGTFTPQGDGSVKYVAPSTTSIKKFAAVALIEDGDDKWGIVITNGGNIAASVDLALKQGDMVTLPLEIQSIGTSVDRLGWYFAIGTPGVVAGS